VRYLNTFALYWRFFLFSAIKKDVLFGITWAEASEGDQLDLLIRNRDPRERAIRNRSALPICFTPGIQALCSLTAFRVLPQKKVSWFGAVPPISILYHNIINTMHPNKGKPAAMLGRKASGPGVGQDSGVAR